MNRTMIVTGTITYAIKGRDFLRRKGYKASVERSSPKERIGCGYGIVVNGNGAKEKELLADYGIKILDVRPLK